MKSKVYFMIILSVTFLFTKCDKKDDEIEDEKTDMYFTNFGDTLLNASDFYPINSSEVFYNIDIDKDTIVDVSISLYTSYSSFAGSTSYVKISPKNGFELAFTDIIVSTWYWDPDIIDTIYYFDTVMIPKEYFNEGSISIEDSFTNNALMVKYASQPGYPGDDYNSGKYYGLPINDDYRYIAFRQVGINNNELAWLKFKLISASSIVLNSCRYNMNENILKIE